MNYYFCQLVVLIDEWIASPANNTNKRFAVSYVDSYDIFEQGYRLIFHEPNITFRYRGVVCESPDIPPEQ